MNQWYVLKGDGDSTFSNSLGRAKMAQITQNTKFFVCSEGRNSQDYLLVSGVVSDTGESLSQKKARSKSRPILLPDAKMGRRENARKNVYCSSSYIIQKMSAAYG